MKKKPHTGRGSKSPTSSVSSEGRGSDIGGGDQGVESGAEGSSRPDSGEEEKKKSKSLKGANILGAAKKGLKDEFNKIKNIKNVLGNITSKPKPTGDVTAFSSESRSQTGSELDARQDVAVFEQPRESQVLRGSQKIRRGSQDRSKQRPSQQQPRESQFAQRSSAKLPAGSREIPRGSHILSLVSGKKTKQSGTRSGDGQVMAEPAYSDSRSEADFVSEGEDEFSDESKSEESELLSEEEQFQDFEDIEESSLTRAEMNGETGLQQRRSTKQRVSKADYRSRPSQIVRYDSEETEEEVEEEEEERPSKLLGHIANMQDAHAAQGIMESIAARPSRHSRVTTEKVQEEFMEESEDMTIDEELEEYVQEQFTEEEYETQEQEEEEIDQQRPSQMFGHISAMQDSHAQNKQIKRHSRLSESIAERTSESEMKRRKQLSESQGMQRKDLAAGDQELDDEGEGDKDEEEGYDYEGKDDTLTRTSVISHIRGKQALQSAARDKLKYRSISRPSEIGAEYGDGPFEGYTGTEEGKEYRGFRISRSRQMPARDTIDLIDETRQSYLDDLKQRRESSTASKVSASSPRQRLISLARKSNHEKSKSLLLRDQNLFKRQEDDASRSEELKRKQRQSITDTIRNSSDRFGQPPEDEEQWRARADHDLIMSRGVATRHDLRDMQDEEGQGGLARNIAASKRQYIPKSNDPTAMQRRDVSNYMKVDDSTVISCEDVLSEDVINEISGGMGSALIGVDRIYPEEGEHPTSESVMKKRSILGKRIIYQKPGTEPVHKIAINADAGRQSSQAITQPEMFRESFSSVMKPVKLLPYSLCERLDYPRPSNVTCELLTGNKPNLPGVPREESSSVAMRPIKMLPYDLSERLDFQQPIITNAGPVSASKYMLDGRRQSSIMKQTTDYDGLARRRGSSGKTSEQKKTRGANLDQRVSLLSRGPPRQNSIDAANKAVIDAIKADSNLDDKLVLVVQSPDQQIVHLAAFTQDDKSNDSIKAKQTSNSDGFLRRSTTSSYTMKTIGNRNARSNEQGTLEKRVTVLSSENRQRLYERQPRESVETVTNIRTSNASLPPETPIILLDSAEEPADQDPTSEADWIPVVPKHVLSKVVEIEEVGELRDVVDLDSGTLPPEDQNLDPQDFPLEPVREVDSKTNTSSLSLENRNEDLMTFSQTTQQPTEVKPIVRAATTSERIIAQPTINQANKTNETRTVTPPPETGGRFTLHRTPTMESALASPRPRNDPREVTFATNAGISAHKLSKHQVPVSVH